MTQHQSRSDSDRGTAASLEANIRDACLRARKAARQIAPRSTAEKNAVLEQIARGLEEPSNVAAVLAANRADLDAAKAKGTKGALLDRLMLDEARVRAMAKSVREVAALPDPVGEVVSSATRPSGITVKRVRVPLGVIAMIYEARPNVTVEASALTLKAGNAVLLRGGSEAERSNKALADVIGQAIELAGFPRAAVFVLPFTDRDAVRVLVQHYKGVCHLFVDAGADVDEAAKIILNAKMSRPGVCNALECLLVDAKDASRTLPPIARALLAAGCELRGDARARELVPEAKVADEKADGSGDWGREFLDAILAVRVVDGLDGALAHVADFGSGHTEAILTRDPAHAERWRREVDAACVVVNASTRFHDGGELGLGAEIGIATSRLHWRGPMGLEALTTMKWVVDGEGQIRG